VATIDPVAIRRWWTGRPDANVGLACGLSGVFVLDIDPRHGGDDTLADLIARYGALPATVETITGGGGRHILFASPGGIGNRPLGVGVDVRGDGGYIVAPGSVHVSGGTYEWEVSSHPDDVPISAAPDWLIGLLRQPPAQSGHSRSAPVPERIPEGQRHDALTRFAGILRNRGLVADEIYGCLRVVNETRCVPPDDDAELRKLANSMMEYAVGSAPFYAPSGAAGERAAVIRIEPTRVRV
jgi:hypothetical protein